MKRIFYIDIENVGMKEISRIRELKETDKVILFINKNEKELYKKVCFELSGSKAAVEIQTFNSRVKNALDFQICSSIGMFTEQISGEIYIVSKDKGYESAIEFFKNQGKTIKRIESVNNLLHPQDDIQEKIREKTRQAVSSSGILQGTTKQIKLCIRVMCENATKKEFHNALQRAFKDIENIRPLYKCLLPVYREYVLNGN